MTITAVFETFEELKTFAENILSTGPIKEPVCSVEVDKPHETAPAPAVRKPAPQAAPAVTQTEPPTQQAAPVQASVQQTAPPATQTTVQAPVQQAVSVPTTAATYTLDDLARAAMPLMDSGRMSDLQQLLAQFGTDALPALPPAQYGAFATALRGLGAQI